MTEDLSVAPVAPVEAPVVAPVVAPVEAAPVVAPVVAPVSPEAVKPAEGSILGDALKPVETAPIVPVAEVKPAEVVAPVVENKEEGQSDEPAPPPTYETFKLPEGVTLEAEGLKKFTDGLAELELKGKVDHAALQEFGQKAVDTYVAEVQKAVETLTQSYHTEWEKTKNDWKESFMSDPEIGGNRWQTTVDSALSFIRTHGGNETQQKEFQNLMNISGVGNHPAMIRLLSNAGRTMKEGSPLAAATPVSPPKSKVSTMYGKNS